MEDFIAFHGIMASSMTNSEGSGSSSTARTAETMQMYQAGNKRPRFLFLDAQTWTRTIAIISMGFHALLLFMIIYEASVVFREDGVMSWTQRGAVLLVMSLSCSGMNLGLFLLLRVGHKSGRTVCPLILFDFMTTVILASGAVFYVLDMDPRRKLIIITATTAFCFVQSSWILVINSCRKRMEREEVERVLLDEFLMRVVSVYPNKAVGTSSSYDEAPGSQQQLDPHPPATSDPRVSAPTTDNKSFVSSNESLETVVISSVHFSPSSSRKIPEYEVIHFINTDDENDDDEPLKIPARGQSSVNIGQETAV